MEIKEAIEKLYVACTNYDKEITGKLGTEREYEGSYEQAYDIVLKELESLQITNDLLYKTNKDLMKKQMQNIENIGTIELLGNEKWSIE